jgi:hypothetical protein
MITPLAGWSAPHLQRAAENIKEKIWGHKVSRLLLQRRTS